MDISVIMPVYNMKAHLQYAIESFRNQTIKEKELICIDDFSTDGSYELLEQFAQEDSRIIVYRMNKNGGAGPARNKGISVARGKYLAFLDADDSFTSNQAIEKMIAMADEVNADICGGLVQECYDGSPIPYHRFRDAFTASESVRRITVEEIRDVTLYQGYIFRREYLISKRIEFPTLRRYQDPPFLAEALCGTDQIYIVKCELYCHKLGQKKRFNVEIICDILEGILMNIRLSEQYGIAWLSRQMYDLVNNAYFDYCLQIIRERYIPGIRLLLDVYDLGMRLGEKTEPVEYLFDAETFGDDEIYRTGIILKRIFNNEDRIVLYGAGNKGVITYKTITKYDICKIDRWVDQYKSGEKIEGVTIESPHIICEYSDLDEKVFISIVDKKIANDVRAMIEDYGIMRSKIYEW